MEAKKKLNKEEATIYNEILELQKKNYDLIFHQIQRYLNENREILSFWKEKNNISKEYNAISLMGNIIASNIYNTYLMIRHRGKISGVYFIENEINHKMKIGMSKDVLKRLKDLESMCRNHFGMENCLKLRGVILDFTDNLSRTEKAFHKKYEKFHVHGEWFNLKFDDIKEEYFPESDCLEEADFNGEIYKFNNILFSIYNADLNMTDVDITVDDLVIDEEKYLTKYFKEDFDDFTKTIDFKGKEFYLRAFEEMCEKYGVKNYLKTKTFLELLRENSKYIDFIDMMNIVYERYPNTIEDYYHNIWLYLSNIFDK